jgi:hypothetical protein
VVRSLWYFQWNLATAYRRRIADLFTMTVPALLLVIRKDGTDRPVSTLLTELKGPTDPGRRRPGELRYELGRFSFLLNLVHTADEPADVIRELGLHLDYATRGEVLRQALDGVDNSAWARTLAEQLYAAAPARDLSFEPAAARLREQAERLGGELIASLAVQGNDGLRSLLSTAWRHGVALDPWDVTVVGSVVFPMKDKTFEPVIAAVTAADWQPAVAGR